MKTVMALAFILSSATHAKIVMEKESFFVETKGNKAPIAILNNLAKANAIEKVKLFDGGNVHMLAFAKKNEKEKIYSVAEDGYMYSLKPFTDYEVKSITSKGLVNFKQEPKRNYKIDSKGFFIH
ncbi:MAG TPA: hypothetical protein VNJ08_17630 [Bacteriovoracaceae bacterium]|nr:hypothetical protein [Bacteriovoracaceae bacterium]